MEQNLFIQMTKLHNAKGRISYITSTAKQENLYAIYETAYCEAKRPDLRSKTVAFRF